MVGIVSYGAYIPIYRLSRQAIGSHWGKYTGSGEKAVANADEDTITMAVEAVIDAMTDIDRQTVDGLYLASTSTPYREKQSASIVRAATDLREDISTMDFTNSLRSASNAMTAGINALKAGEVGKVMIVASESRLPAPNSEFESVFGDGAAAFLLGNSDVAAAVEGNYTVTSEFLDVWRKENDRYHWVWEDRFIRDEGYQKILQGAVQGLMRKYQISPKDVTKAVFYAPDARTHTIIARNLGFDTKKQVQTTLFDNVGDTGCAFAPMMLVAALEEAKPGDRLLFATYGDGADAYLLRVTEQIEKVRNRRAIKRHLSSKIELPSYGIYLQMRNMMEWAPDVRPRRRSPVTAIWRDRKMFYALYGQKCRKCGQVQYPKQRLCMYCQTKDDFEEVRLSDKKGKVFTFSIDERAREIILPLVRTVIDLDGGGRYYSPMTDRDVTKIDVGTPVELTFRLLFDGTKEGSGFRNYIWKVRPVRC